MKTLPHISKCDPDRCTEASGSSELNFTTSILSATFTALNSVKPGDINAFPNQTTGGNGSVTGQEVQFNVNFLSLFDLPADHYFFVPQVQLDNGDFFWLSSVRPIVAPGTPFATDLQAWTRDEFLDPVAAHWNRHCRWKSCSDLQYGVLT